MEVEILLGYTLVFYQPVLGVAPEALDAVDVVARVAPLDELVLAVAHPVMVLAAPVHQAVAGREPVGAHDGVLGYPAVDDLHQRPARDVRDDLRADLPAALEQAEDDCLARPAAPHPPCAEAALVGLGLAVEGAIGLGDPGPQHAVVAVDRVAVEPLGEAAGSAATSAQNSLSSSLNLRSERCEFVTYLFLGTFLLLMA